MKLDKPIIESRLAKDWYFVTTGFFFWKRHFDAFGRSKFKNRSPHIVLGDRIDFGRLREEIEHVKTLMHTPDEIAWLRRTAGIEVPDGFLTNNSLSWLQGSKLSDIDLERVNTPNGPSFKIEAHGRLCELLDWETFILPIITYLNSEWVLKQAGVTREEIHKEALRRNKEKMLRMKAELKATKIGSFGLRRQLDQELSLMIDRQMYKLAPELMAGISNAWVAMQLGMNPTGTFPHAAPMAYAGLCKNTDEAIRASHMQFFDDWEATFPKKWRTAVTDTYGSKAFFEDFGKARATRWDVYKLDSGVLHDETDKLIAWFVQNGVDPKTKYPNPTDGLNDDTIIAMDQRYRNVFAGIRDGLGTMCSNDTGLETYGSFVVKLAEVNGRGLVKLSNNLNKASGEPEDVERFKHIFGYTNTASQRLVV